jgi:toxin ParE1/3/4
MAKSYRLSPLAEADLEEIRPDFQKHLCGSHAIYFLMYADRLDVIRILHQSQDVKRHL